MKKSLIIIGIFLVGLAIVLFFVLHARNAGPAKSFFGATIPADGAMNVSPNQQISISFTQTISANDVSFGIAPLVKYSLKAEGNTLVVTPAQPLSAGVTYTYAVRYPLGGDQATQTKTFSFTVAGTPTTLGSSPAVGANEARQAYLLQNYPDEFLANLTPYSDKYFSITSTFAAPVDTFSVILSGNPTLAKSIFIAWLKSLGLTDAQIHGFVVTYKQNPAGGTSGPHDTAVGNLIAKLPYAGQYFSLGYTYASGGFTFTLSSAYQQQGNQEFDLFLRANGIDDRSWLQPNFQVVVQ